MKTIFYLLILAALGFGGFKYYEHLENSKENWETVTLTRKKAIGKDDSGKLVYKEFVGTEKYKYTSAMTDSMRDAAKKEAEKRALQTMKEEYIEARKSFNAKGKVKTAANNNIDRAEKVKVEKMAIGYYKSILSIFSKVTPLPTKKMIDPVNKKISAMNSKLKKAVRSKKRLKSSDEKACEELLGLIKKTLSDKRYEKTRKGRYNSSSVKDYEAYSKWFYDRFSSYPSLRNEIGS